MNYLSYLLTALLLVPTGSFGYSSSGKQTQGYFVPGLLALVTGVSVLYGYFCYTKYQESQQRVYLNSLKNSFEELERYVQLKGHVDQLAHIEQTKAPGELDYFDYESIINYLNADSVLTVTNRIEQFFAREKRDEHKLLSALEFWKKKNNYVCIDSIEEYKAEFEHYYQDYKNTTHFLKKHERSFDLIQNIRSLEVFYNDSALKYSVEQIDRDIKKLGNLLNPEYAYADEYNPTGLRKERIGYMKEYLRPYLLRLRDHSVSNL